MTNLSFRFKLLISSNKGGIDILFISMIFVILLFMISILSADYALYSYKTKIIAKSIDNAVLGAIQEIDYSDRSKGFNNEFINEGYTDYKIKFNIESADDVFWNLFESNCGLKKENVEKYLIRAVIEPIREPMLQYVISFHGKEDATGTFTDPNYIETITNYEISSLLNEGYEGKRNDVIYVNSNPKTNKFERRPYYLVFIRDIQINGLILKRYATFVGLAASKVTRK